MPQAKTQWDIFCKIVDNFGDIGVCWRLARQLFSEHNLQVTLWVDDLTVAQKIIPSLNVALTTQSVAGVVIKHWQQHGVFESPAEVVVEAFSCGLPDAYLAKMQPQQIWVNLEYLSAETWVDDFHAKHAQYPNLKRHFYYPGFTANTGGLLRERTVPQAKHEMADDSIKVSLFCYANAPILALLTALANSPQITTLFVPTNNHIQKYADFFNQVQLQVGEDYVRGSVTLKQLPFLSQDQYDALLHSCDVNFVRGEDSWVRAIWAAQPMIWQPYVQEENAHMHKLEAFLTLFYATCDSTVGTKISAANHAWSDGSFSDKDWLSLVENLADLKLHAEKQAKELSKQLDLASKLVIFCNNL
jgi:uncharacterized repeat protein (TIGR03837 family)